jgi:hypothetical protein
MALVCLHPACSVTYAQEEKKTGKSRSESLTTPHSNEDLAAISFVMREPWRFAGAAATLGAGAIIFQFSLLVASAIVGLLFVMIVLNKLDISL